MITNQSSLTLNYLPRILNLPNFTWFYPILKSPSLSLSVHTLPHTSVWPLTPLKYRSPILIPRLTIPFYYATCLKALGYIDNRQLCSPKYCYVITLHIETGGKPLVYALPQGSINADHTPRDRQLETYPKVCILPIP